MNNKDIKKEYAELKKEIFKNIKKTKINYKDKIVWQREILLALQVYLGNIIEAKRRKDKEKEFFDTEVYKKLKKFYYSYNKC